MIRTWRSPFLFAKDMQKGKLDEVCPSWKNQNAFIAVMRHDDDDDDDDDDSSCCLRMCFLSLSSISS